MKRTRRLVVCIGACVALTLAGCVSPTSPDATPTGGTTQAPGLTRAASGPAVAYGWVVREDLEGGFWALVDSPPLSSVVQPKVVVVLLSGAVSQADIALLDGSYARATGAMADGASIRMSGPEMTVDAIAGAPEYVPK
jgi:hypothetical protein